MMRDAVELRAALQIRDVKYQYFRLLLCKDVMKHNRGFCNTKYIRYMDSNDDTGGRSTALLRNYA